MILIRQLAIFLAVSLWCSQIAGAHVMRESTTCSNSKQPIYKWADNDINPRGIILAIHGVTLHGGSYDALGNLLAKDGYVVVAPDLQGFGHYYHDSQSDLASKTVVYDKSLDDLIALIRQLKSTYPDKPLICIGESVGAHLALRLASIHPELVNGLVLSASSTKVHLVSLPLILKDATLWTVRPHRQVDLNPYISRYISDDPRIAEERISDPLSRNNLGMAQLIKFGWMSRRTLDIVENIPPTVPILILQGTSDKLYKPEGISLLASHLRSTDKQVNWFPFRGHILLETNYLNPDTISTVLPWLAEHVKSQAAGNLAVQQQSPPTGMSKTD